MNILYSFLSVPVRLYDTTRRLFAFSGELPTEGIPPVNEIPVASLVVRRAVGTFPREDHIVHVEGPPQTKLVG